MRQLWDAEAASFDEQPDHGLRDPAVRAAWAALLLPLLPAPPARVADLGCGTGTLSVLLAEAGHDVHGVDYSAPMLALAATKADAAGVEVRLTQGDAQTPLLPAAAFDAVLARHVLWALPDPAAALGAWIALLAPGGVLVLVEGRWSTGFGLTADECRALVLAAGREAEVELLDDAAFWGGPIDDERYLLVSRR